VSEALEAGTPVASPSGMADHGVESTLPSLGTQLRVAREAKGSSIADVVQVIRFSAHQIEALERDDYGSLPGATSVRGLVRNYAKFLKLDPLPLLALIEPAVPVPEADVRPPTNMGEAEQPGLAERVPSRLLSAVVGVLMLLAALYWYLDPSSESTVVKRAVPQAASAPPAPAVEAGSAVALATPAATVVGSGPPRRRSNRRRRSPRAACASSSTIDPGSRFATQAGRLCWRVNIQRERDRMWTASRRTKSG
jgi:cytoskeleton protein RodZ